MIINFKIIIKKLKLKFIFIFKIIKCFCYYNLIIENIFLYFIDYLYIYFNIKEINSKSLIF